MIEGVRIKAIREKTDWRGALQPMVRADDPEFFDGFGEIYFSISNPGVVKGWHCHTEQTGLLSCVRGSLRLVLFDERERSSTRGELQVVFMGDQCRQLVRIPPGVVYGWRNDGFESAILANCANRPHSSNESRKIPLDAGIVPYHW